MSDIFLLSKKQFNRLKSYFPLSHGMPRIDDHRDQWDHFRLMIDATHLKAQRRSATCVAD
jgi:hypothetical protein